MGSTKKNGKQIKKDIVEHIFLSKEAAIAFLSALENPPEPSAKLKEAMKRHSDNI